MSEPTDPLKKAATTALRLWIGLVVGLLCFAVLLLIFVVFVAIGGGAFLLSR